MGPVIALKAVHDLGIRHSLFLKGRIKVHMKGLVSFLLFGILSLPFFHDHQVLRADEGYGARASEHSTLVRHVHLAPNSPHFPKPESDDHGSKNQWLFLEHVALTTLASAPSTLLSTILHNVGGSSGDYKSPVLHQSLWEPTSPVRGSPLNNSDTFLPSSNLPSIHSGRAPPLFSF